MVIKSKKNNSKVKMSRTRKHKMRGGGNVKASSTDPFLVLSRKLGQSTANETGYAKIGGVPVSKVSTNSIAQEVASRRKYRKAPPTNNIAQQLAKQNHHNIFYKDIEKSNSNSLNNRIKNYNLYLNQIGQKVTPRNMAQLIAKKRREQIMYLNKKAAQQAQKTKSVSKQKQSTKKGWGWSSKK